MKAIGNNELYSIVKDDGNGLYLLPIWSDNEQDDLFYISFSSTGLIIDPTDSDIDNLETKN